MTEEPNLNKFAELGFIDGDMTSKRRPNDVQMCVQTRLDKTRKEKNYVQNCTNNFALFYSAYPIKRSKKKAFEAWKKTKPDIDVCLKAIENQKIEKQKLKEAKEFCPGWKNPATWLNQGCWEDEIIKTERENERDEFLRRHGANG